MTLNINFLVNLDREGAESMRKSTVPNAHECCSVLVSERHENRRVVNASIFQQMVKRGSQEKGMKSSMEQKLIFFEQQCYRYDKYNFLMPQFKIHKHELLI